MKPVIQQDRTGCGIASVAALAGRTYAAVKREAAQLGIAVSHARLWSDTRHVRRLLAHFRIPVKGQEDFVSWSALPDCALLAIKWHREKDGPAWHWVVFVRDASGSYVLDPKKALRTNRRTDFGRMKPKWFIGLRGMTRAKRGANPGPP
jgi:hypothetical protein